MFAAFVSTPDRQYRLFALLCVLSLSGCAVTFEDYPLGDPHPNRAASGDGGSAGSYSIAAGSGGLPVIRENVIDDFEDDDPDILSFQGRHGYWMGINDGSGSQSPPVDRIVGEPLSVLRAGSSSTQGLHVKTSGFIDYGAVVRAWLNKDAGADERAYDISEFQGISFAARIEDGSRSDLRIQLPASGTLDNCSECSDHFGVDLMLSQQWAEYYVPLDQFRQEGKGVPQLGTLDKTKVYAVQFHFWGGAASDMWIDGLRFY